MDTIKIGYTDSRAGLSVYAILISNSGQFWSSTGVLGFEDYNGAVDDYAIELINTGTSYYEAEVSHYFPSSKYLIRVYEKVGGSKDLASDKLLTVQSFFYSESQKKEIDVEQVQEQLLSSNQQLEMLASSDIRPETVTLGGINKKLDDILALVKSIHSRSRS